MHCSCLPYFYTLVKMKLFLSGEIGILQSDHVNAAPDHEQWPICDFMWYNLMQKEENWWCWRRAYERNSIWKENECGSLKNGYLIFLSEIFEQIWLWCAQVLIIQWDQLQVWKERLSSAKVRVWLRNIDCTYTFNITPNTITMIGLNWWYQQIKKLG